MCITYIQEYFVVCISCNSHIVEVMAFWRKWIAILWPFAVFVQVAFGAGRMLFGCDALDLFSVCYFSFNARPQYIAETIGNVYAVCWVHRAWMTLKGKNNTKFSSSNIPCIHDELYFPTEFRAAIWHALINYGPCSYSMCDLIKLNSAKFWTFFFFFAWQQFSCWLPVFNGICAVKMAHMKKKTSSLDALPHACFLRNTWKRCMWH